MLTSGALLALAALAVQRVRQRWLLAPIGLAAVAAGLPAEMRTPGEFLLQYVPAALAGGCALMFCFWIARRNYLAYALVLWIMVLRAPMTQLFANANPALQMQGFALAFVLAVSMLWAVWPSVASRVPAG